MSGIIPNSSAMEDYLRVPIGFGPCLHLVSNLNWYLRYFINIVRYY